MASKQFWYLDTSYLISYLSTQTWNESLKQLSYHYRDQGRIAKGVIGNLKRENVKVPAIGWGEAATQLKEMGVDVGITSLMADFETAWLKQEEIRIFSKIVSELSERDARLQPFDCLIVAFAMACSECCGLLTFDKRLVDNKAIRGILEEEYGGRSFIVNDSPW